MAERVIAGVPRAVNRLVRSLDADDPDRRRAAWAAYIRRALQIGDFRAWKEHDAYRVA